MPVHQPGRPTRACSAASASLNRARAIVGFALRAATYRSFVGSQTKSKRLEAQEVMAKNTSAGKTKCPTGIPLHQVAFLFSIPEQVVPERFFLDFFFIPERLPSSSPHPCENIPTNGVVQKRTCQAVQGTCRLDCEQQVCEQQASRTRHC